MKQINSLQELWSYCLFCPLCQDITRDIHVAIGPHEVIQVKKFRKINHMLHVLCNLNVMNEKYTVKFSINCLDNSFETKFSSPEISETKVDKASAASFFLDIQGICLQCNDTHVNSSNLELDLLKSKVSNIGIELEGIHLLKQKDKFHVTMNYDASQIQVSRIIEDEVTGELLDENKVVSFPIIDLDFSNPKKAVNRIKTLLVFS